MLPARELYGDMLLAAGRPAEALAEYEKSQLREPNRYRRLFGAGQAAAQAGNRDKARLYFSKLAEMAGPGVRAPRAASGQAVPGEKLNQAQGDRRLDRRQVRRLSDTEIRLLHARVRRERIGTIWASDIGGQTKTSRQTKTPREPDLARRGSHISKPPTEDAQN